MLLTASLSVLSGCDKLTPENYSQLKVGMEYAELVKIIGYYEQRCVSESFGLKTLGVTKEC